jgi:nucleotide-binding universal stress UspA family protein
MYDHILVPLDGSAISEVAIEHAVRMAENFRAELTLLRVVALPTVPGVNVAAVEQALVAESEAYLREIARRIPAQHVTTHTTVRVGKAADTIIEHACQCGNAMVVMATHGHRHIEQWPLGSIAEKVLRSMRVPVFLVRAPQPEHVT